jgi:hypothetical protein
LNFYRDLPTTKLLFFFVLALQNFENERTDERESFFVDLILVIFLLFDLNVFGDRGWRERYFFFFVFSGSVELLVDFLGLYLSEQSILLKKLGSLIHGILLKT